MVVNQMAVKWIHEMCGLYEKKWDKRLILQLCHLI